MLMLPMAILMMEDMVRDADARMLRRIYSKKRKGQMRDLVSRVLPRAGKIVAGLALTFFIGLSTAVATVQSVRINVLNALSLIPQKKLTADDISSSFGCPFAMPPTSLKGPNVSNPRQP